MQRFENCLMHKVTIKQYLGIYIPLELPAEFLLTYCTMAVDIEEQTQFCAVLPYYSGVDWLH